MADSSSTTHAITRAAHASLNLVSSSAELLSLSQLLATRTELKKTLAVVNDRVQAKLSGALARNILTLSDSSVFCSLSLSHYRLDRL